MQKTTQTPYERALARADAEGVRVVMDFGDHWRVRGSDGVTLYVVCQDDNGLRCNCKSSYYCKHQAVCQQRLNEQQAEREQAMQDALAEVAARESVAAQMEAWHAQVAAWNDAALAETDAWQAARQDAPRLLAALLLYGAALGQAKAAEREAQWQRYQTARENNWYC